MGKKGEEKGEKCRRTEGDNMRRRGKQEGGKKRNERWREERSGGWRGKGM